MAAILFRKLHDDNHRTPLDTRVTQAKRVLCDPPAFQRPPANDGCGIHSRLVQIHDFAAQHLEPLRRKRFGKEVCVVVYCAYERHNKFLGLDHIANEEMSSRDVFRSIMMLRVIG